MREQERQGEHADKGKRKRGEVRLIPLEDEDPDPKQNGLDSLSHLIRGR